MTKDEAIAFLKDQGHYCEPVVVSEDACRIGFKFRGAEIELFTSQADPDYVYLRCGYRLEPANRDELLARRALAQIQDDLKVVKLGLTLEDEAGVFATAEQFLADGPSFAPIFWRTVSLVYDASNRAWRELNTTVVADEAADRFTEALEAELQKPTKKPDSE